MKNAFLTSFAVLSAGALACPASAQLIFKTYVAGMDSTWNVSANWAPFGVPNNSGPFQYHAYIDDGHIVSLDLAAAVTNLSLENQAKLWIANGRTITLFGGTVDPGGSNVFNQGQVRVYAQGSITSIRIDGGPVEFFSTEDGEVLMEAGTGAGFSEIYGTGGPTTSWVINRPGHTFRGAGYFTSVNVINEGMIKADNPARALEIRVPDFTAGGTFQNDGTLRAENGATLRLMRTAPALTARYVHEFGVVEALDGSTVLLDGRTIQHYGTFRTEGTGVIRVTDNFCSIRGSCTIDGNLRIDDGRALDIDGTINLAPFTGKVWIDSVSPGAGGLRLTSLGDATLSGGGVVEMGDNVNNYILSSATNRRLTNLNCTIRGGGKIGDNGLSVTNQGTIQANATNAPLTIDPPSTGDFTNDGGSLEAMTAPGIIINDGPFINTGGGVVRIHEGSSLARTGTYLQNGGATQVFGPMTVTGGTLELAGGTLHATDSITAAVNNSGGIVNPGNIGQSADILSVTGTYTQGAGGQLVVQIGGLFPGEYDWLTVSDNVTLDGDLLIATIDGYVPDEEDSIMIINSSSGMVSGQFSSVNDGWEVVYAANAVIITPVDPCPADVSGADGVVNIDDLLGVINSWGAAGGPADVTGNGIVNIDDLLAVINAWGACL